MITRGLLLAGTMALGLAAVPASPAGAGGVVRDSGFGCVDPGYSFTVGPGHRIFAATSDTTSKVTPSGNSTMTCIFHGPSSAAAHESSLYYDSTRHSNTSGQLCLTPTGYTRDSTSTVVGRTLVLTCTRSKKSAVPAQFDWFQSFRDGNRQFVTAGMVTSVNPMHCPYPGAPGAPEACPDQY